MSRQPRPEKQEALEKKLWKPPTSSAENIDGAEFRHFPGREKSPLNVEFLCDQRKRRIAND
jgi:hypothetical protein